MKSPIPVALRRAVVVVLALAAPSLARAEPAVVTILHVNDTHSRLAAWGPKDANLDGTVGGLGKAAALVAAERARDPEALFVHAGDVFNGDLFFNAYLGVAELQLLEALGLAAIAPGNHEFQFGPDFLAAVLGATWPAGNGIPVVGTNLDLTNAGLLRNWVTAPCTGPQSTGCASGIVKEVHGVKIGLFGLTTPFDSLEQPAPVVIRTDLAEVSKAAVAELRAQGAQVVLCLAHLGMELSRDLARAVPGIDVIVNGHDHVALAQPEKVGATVIVSAGEFYRHVGRLRLSVDGANVQVLDYALLGADADVAPLAPFELSVAALLQGIVARYGDVYHAQLGWAGEVILRSSDPRHAKRDTAIGNLFTDAYRARGGTQIAVEAAGFLEDDLLAGPIVPVDVFRAMPYGVPELDAAAGTLTVRPFRLATFRIRGADLVKGLEIGLATADIFLQVSGIRFEYDSRRPAGARLLLDTVHVGGRKLAPGALYSVTANEGALFFMGALGIPVADVRVLPDTAWAVVSDRIAAHGVVEPEVSGRIRDVAVRGR